jgi:hypothetical protein
LVAVLDGLEGGGVLDNRLLGLDGCPDLNHVFIAAQNRDLALGGFFLLILVGKGEGK